MNLLRKFIARPSGSHAGPNPHHKPVCTSVTRTLHRLGMTGRVEVRAMGVAGEPALFITLSRAALKHSQAAMAMLSREIVAHAQRKYATEIEGVYWRIEVDFEAQDDLEGDVFGPTTIGYLVEETSALHHRADARFSELDEMMEAIDAPFTKGDPAQADALARQVRNTIDLRRHERCGADALHPMQSTTTPPKEVTP